MILVARPDILPLKEAGRASQELAALGIARQLVVINGKLDAWDDDLTKGLYEKQESALQSLPETLEGRPFFEIPLRSYNVTGLDHVRALLTGDIPEGTSSAEAMKPVKTLSDVIDDLEKHGRKLFSQWARAASARRQQRQPSPWASPVEGIRFT